MADQCKQAAMITPKQTDFTSIFTYNIDSVCTAAVSLTLHTVLLGRWSVMMILTTSIPGTYAPSRPSQFSAFSTVAL